MPDEKVERKLCSSSWCWQKQSQVLQKQRDGKGGGRVVEAATKHVPLAGNNNNNNVAHSDNMAKVFLTCVCCLLHV